MQSSPTKPFEAGQQNYIQTMVERFNEKLLSETDLLNPKVQGLHRLYGFYMRLYLNMRSQDRRNRSGQDSAAQWEIPPYWIEDPVRFAQEALNTPLFDHQQQFCRSPKRITLMIAGRGAGKSLAAIVVAIHQAATRPHHTVLVVSSGQRMSTDFGTRILDLLRESNIRPLIKTISAEQVTFKNGSSIKLLPANPDTIRGYHPRQTGQPVGITVILDEACFMEQGDEVRKAVEYAMITTTLEEGRLYIVSSPSTTSSWVYRYALQARDPDSDTCLIQCPSSANPHITPKEIERLRRSKNDMEFRAEVMGEWVDGAFGLFKGLVQPNIVQPPLPPVPDDATYALGADLALSYSPTHDRNAFAVVARWWSDPQGGEPEAHYRLVDMQILDSANDKELRQTVNRLVEQYNIQTAGIEQYQGKALAEHCQALGVETQLIAPTAGLQQMVFHELHRLLRQNLLELPHHLPPIFFEEMKGFEYQRQANGRISFGHPSGGHDDSVYALVWAIHVVQSGLVVEYPSYAPPLIATLEKHPP